MSRCVRLVYVLVLAVLSGNVAVEAAPALWEVRDDNSVVWVFGSIHILPENLAWRTPLFDATLAAADKVVFETDIRPAATAELGAKAFARGVYVDGTVLTDVLDDELEARLRTQLAAIDIPFGNVLAMRPWMASNTISIATLMANSFTAEGVEFVLEPELIEDRMVFLETGDAQLEVLAGAPEAEQIAMLAATLDQIDNLPQEMDELLSNWLAGAPDKLAPLFDMEMGGFGDAFLDRLLYARNQNWIAPIEQMLASDSQNLVVVGTAHLIGAHSVLDLLEQAGYTVQRIQ